MTLIMQLEIFIDNENKFIYSKNLISQLLIILSPLQHCSKQQSSLHADARPAAHCEAFWLGRKLWQDPFPLDLMGSNNEYTTLFVPTRIPLSFILFIHR